MKYLTLILFGFAGILALAVGCQDSGSSIPTSPTLSRETLGETGSLGPAGQQSSNRMSSGRDSRSSESDSVSEDSISEESSSDDPSSDDSSSDDSNSDDSGSSVGDSSRLQGVLFELGTCRGPSLPCTLTLGSGKVLINEDTRLDIEPMLAEGVSGVQFLSVLTAGLPLKARGSGDPLVATRVRIDDELKAQGRVSSAGADLFVLQVNDDPSAPTLTFRLLTGVALPASELVRIEANVPADLSASPIVFEVFAIQPR